MEGLRSREGTGRPHIQTEPGPTFVENLDRYKATSHLLGPYKENTPQDTPTVHAFTGYDISDIRALGGSATKPPLIYQSVSTSDSLNDADAKATFDPAIHNLWNGLPLYLVTWELASLSLSICFLTLGACVASLKNKEESPWSHRIIQATRIAPSIWPIVFSGVLGGAVRGFADWRVERGISLLALEQLLGSLTMANSVITIFRWSIFRLSSAILISLWAFNPLGSQASFRGAYLRDTYGTTEGHITYYNANLSTQLYLSSFMGASTRSKPAIRALYSSTLYDYVSNTQYVDTTNKTYKGIITLLGGQESAAIQAAMDPWGNVRIPDLNYLPDYDSSHPQRWLDTTWDKSVLNYSSLLGDRVGGVNRNFSGNSTFIISSSYQHFNCSPWLFLNTTTSNRYSYSNMSRNDSQADVWLLKNTDQNYIQLLRPMTRSLVLTFFVVPATLNTSSAGQREFVFGSRGHDFTRLYTTRCGARTSYVDAQVTCISRGTLGKANCGVNAVRETPNPPAPPSQSVLDSNPHAGNSFVDFVEMLDDIQGGSGQSSATEFYLQDPLTAFTNPTVTSSYTELGELNIATFERRFSLLWNTLWKIAWAKQSVMGGEFTTAQSTMADPIQTLQNTTSHVTFPLPRVYAIHHTWLIIYFISVGVMFFAAVFSLVTHSQCRAPMILGFVSSLIRDSMYFNHASNSTEDGPQKSKRLGRMRVRVADIKGGDETGRVAFAPMEMGKRVQKGRWYE